MDNNEKKLRHSHQRDRIYEYISGVVTHPSAEMIYDVLKHEIDNLSLGTVYRNLKLLESIGKIRKITTVNSVERYDAKCCDHPHFVCEKCGSVKDVHDPDFDSNKYDFKSAPGDKVQWINLIMGGVCSECV